MLPMTFRGWTLGLARVRERFAARATSTWLARHVAAATVLVLAAAAAGTGGCNSGVNAAQSTIRGQCSNGDFRSAAATLSKPEIVEAYGDRSRLLYELEAGTIALACKDYAGVLQHLNAAEGDSAYHYNASTGDVLAKWTLNDNAARFMAQPYMDMYVNSFKMLAYLQQAKMQGYASIEADRQMRKAEYLRSVYSQYMTDMTAKGKGTSEFVKSGLANAKMDSAQAGNFVESPLGAYLSAVTFMYLGDSGNQQVAAKRLLSSIGEQRNFVGGVDATKFESLLTAKRGDMNFLAVVLNGQAPEIQARKLSISAGDKTLSLPFPTMLPATGSARGVWLETDKGVRLPLNLVEDIGCVATENFRRTEPAIFGRTMIRLGVKVGVVVAGTYAVKESTENKLWTTATFVAGMALVYLTESADLRTWTSLPSQAYVLLTKLPAGTERVRLGCITASGQVLGDWQTIEIPASGLATLVERF